MLCMYPLMSIGLLTGCVVGLQGIQGSNAGVLPVTHGVGQGSLLGPKLFSFFTNDLEPHMPFGKHVMYADDMQFLDSDTIENFPSLKVKCRRYVTTAAYVVYAK